MLEYTAEIRKPVKRLHEVQHEVVGEGWTKAAALGMQKRCQATQKDKLKGTGPIECPG